MLPSHSTPFNGLDTMMAEGMLGGGRIGNKFRIRLKREAPQVVVQPNPNQW